MKHLWSVLCAQFIVNAANNNLSLIEITDVITFDADLPDERPLVLSLPSPLYLVSSWIRESDDEAQTWEALLRIKSPVGNVVQETPFTVDLEHTVGHRSIGVVSTIPFTDNGIYGFEACIIVGQDWRAVGAVPVEISCRSPSEGSEDDSPGTGGSTD